MIYVKAYIGVLIAFIVLDAIWLGLIAKSLYASQLGDLMRDNPNMLAAALFYIFYVAGVVFFAVQPSLTSASWWTALLNGAVLGALAYGTYGRGHKLRSVERLAAQFNRSRYALGNSTDRHRSSMRAPDFTNQFWIMSCNSTVNNWDSL